MFLFKGENAVCKYDWSYNLISTQYSNMRTIKDMRKNTTEIQNSCLNLGLLLRKMYIKFGECKSRHVQYNLLNGVNDEKHRYSINVFIVCVDC